MTAFIPVAAFATLAEDTRMPAISLIIPVYNEIAEAPHLAKRLSQALSKLPKGSQAIIVDDGSTDGSQEAIESALAKGKYPGIKFLVHHFNRGYGAALKTGIQAAETEWIAIADADGTYPLAALPKLLQCIDSGARMAVGARPVGQQPAIRRPAKVFLNAFSSYLAGRKIHDINSGLRVFPRETALTYRHLLPDGFSLTSTITMLMAGDGERIDFIPIQYRTRSGSSKIRPVRDMAGFLLLISRMAVAYRPLKVFGPIGSSLCLVGLSLLFLRLFMADNPFGLATTIIFILSGLHFFGLGLLADLINHRTRILRDHS